MFRSLRRYLAWINKKKFGSSTRVNGDVKPPEPLPQVENLDTYSLDAFNRLMKKGFTEDQANALVRELILIGSRVESANQIERLSKENHRSRKESNEAHRTLMNGFITMSVGLFGLLFTSLLRKPPRDFPQSKPEEASLF